MSKEFELSIPWFYEANKNTICCSDWDGNSHVIAITKQDQDVPFAKYIITAVNNYQALIDCLKNSLEIPMPDGSVSKYLGAEILLKSLGEI